ncbi:CIA30 family protein [Tritonibacter mobilis]|uniref:CIA30 family protein n=1 Tax=Tritonibacter mobilis TaxID=379347 RepID=UPI000E0D7781|nr:CIA30 family protein [Tritonibacter mobilis]
MMKLNPKWVFVSDTVMGGVSKGAVTQEVLGARNATVLRGAVSLKNNGGFIQMASDLREDGSEVDVSTWDGIEAVVWGDGATYDIRLRTAQLSKPWQSFRADFASKPEWQRIRIPFASLAAHRVDAVFDPTCVKRIGILAIGRACDALVAVSSIGFYAAS